MSDEQTQPEPLGWKEELKEHAGAHILDYIKRHNLSVGDTNLLSHFWKERGDLIVNQIEWAIDDLVDAATDVQLQDIGMMIARDPKIDDYNENTLRIIQHLQEFRKELNDREVDYEEDGEDLPGEEIEESEVDQRPSAES